MILADSSDIFIVMEWYKWGGRVREREKGLEILPKNLT